jgi:hypothetical protein
LTLHIADYFINSLKYLVQEMGGQIDGVLATWYCLESIGITSRGQVRVFYKYSPEITLNAYLRPSVQLLPVITGMTCCDSPI